jgi:Cu(I)/Ag(I) efflux system membrane fusion protein
MRALFCLLLPLVLFTSPAAAAGAQAPAALVDPAMAIQVALAHDTLEGVAAQAKALAQAATALGPSAAPLAAAATQLATKTDLAEARTAFGNVNETLIAYMKAQGLEPPSGVRIAYCPMADKHWVQKDGAVENPYYGSKMLACGDFTK